MKCPATGCRRKPSVKHYRESPQCIPAVRTVNSWANTSQRKNDKGGRPKKQPDLKAEEPHVAE